MGQPTDPSTLVRRAQAGDEQAFGALVTMHRDRLWSVAYRITNDRHDAEDALQDALTAAWHHLARFRGESSISTWLYRITANAAIAVAKRRRRSELRDELPERAGGTDVADGVVVRDAVRAALDELPPAYRETMVLRELCDFTYDQIAAHQQVGIQTVKSRLSRGRAILRDRLADPH